MSRCQIFGEEEIVSLKRAGSILRACLDKTAERVKPGITTAELDAFADEFICSHEGATPAFKGYQGFPHALCTSVNEQAVHGMPGSYELQEGDIVSIDCGVKYEGLNTDACITVGVGNVSAEAQRLLKVTQEALDKALKQVREGAHVGDISHAVQHHVEGEGFGIIKSLTGHGLGYTLHQFPDVPNFGKAGAGPVLPAGTVIAIEPIVSAGSVQVVDGGDGWTISVKDGALAAHFEHTVLTTDTGCEIIA